MISQIFLLSPRGDTIIYKDFKNNVPKVRGSSSRCPGGPGGNHRLPARAEGRGRRRAPGGWGVVRALTLQLPRLSPHHSDPQSATEVFFRKARSWDGHGKHAPPVFQAEGVQYLHIKVGGLFWVATTRENVSPSLVLELLYRIYWIARVRARPPLPPAAAALRQRRPALAPASFSRCPSNGISRRLL